MLNMIKDPFLLSSCCPCEHLLYSHEENIPLQRENVCLIEKLFKGKLLSAFVTLSPRHTWGKAKKQMAQSNM